MNKYNILCGIFVSCGIFVQVGCDNINSQKLEDKFPKVDTLYLNETFCIEEDSLGIIGGIECNERNLIVYDVFDGYCYSKFDAVSGKYISRFGILGQGPGELLLGGNSILKNEYLYVFNDQIKQIQRIDINSVLQNNDSRFSSVLKYNIVGAQFSELLPINDSIFLGAGFYELGSQFVLFDKDSKIIDHAVDVYNKNSQQNDIFKYLSNQGKLVVHPHKPLFAYSVNFSSNIDFFKLVDNKIICNRSSRFENPKYDYIDENGSLFRVVPSMDAQTGYIDLSSSSQYVYALYSDKCLYDNWKKSNVILVFDWDGNPKMRYVLDREVYYIAVNEEMKRLYAVTKNRDEGWTIVFYGI